MNDMTKVKISIIVMVVMGIVSIIYGDLKIQDARQVGDAIQVAEGMFAETGGLLLVMMSLVVLIYVNHSMEIKELQKEREDLLEKMENMKTSNRIFDGRTEAFREDIIVLRDRIDYLEDKMHKESYSHDIEDEVP